MLKEIQTIFKKNDVAVVFHPVSCSWLAIFNDIVDGNYKMSGWKSTVSEAIAEKNKTILYASSALDSRAKENGWRNPVGFNTKDVNQNIVVDINVCLDKLKKLTSLLS